MNTSSVIEATREQVECQERSGPVVVGVDSSETAAAAAERAVAVAEKLGVGVHVVTGAPRRRSQVVYVGTDEFAIDGNRSELALLDSMRQRLGSDRVTTSLECDSPARSLCEVADRLDARLIVVGNRRVQSAGRVFGSIAGDVLRQAPCDVLVVNPNGD